MSERMSARRGEVYTHTPTGKRVVVLSDDRWNAGSYTGRVLAAPLGRAHAPVSVRCGDQDPVGGFVHVAELGQADAQSLSDCAGILSGATLEAVNRAVVALFDLPY